MSPTLLSDFHFTLPPELIAQTPAEPRDSSRLLVLDRATGDITHRVFRDILEYLGPNDVLVLNETRVIPARLRGDRIRGKLRARVEILLVRHVANATWEALAKPARRLRAGDLIQFSGATARVVRGPENGMVRLCFSITGKKFIAFLNKCGETPTPPYIKLKSDLKRYQTVYAATDEGKARSVAAPTAGLHFTSDLLARLTRQGVQIEKVTLHVGLGTFAPIKTKYIEDHKIHSEFFEIDSATGARLTKAKRSGKRIVAVGTTTTRVLENIPLPNPPHFVGREMPPLATEWRGVGGEVSGQTSLYITPGYKFNFVDALITNFHLPDSSLILLVSAFAGTDNIKKAYREAIKQKYRFYSFGDAMLII